MNKIELIQDAIDRADKLESRLEVSASDVPSFTSLKIRHLLNNLGAISTNYLECGTHKAGHFVSVVYKNMNIFNAFAIDNYSEFYVNGETKEEALRNIAQFTPKGTYAYLIEDDCFNVKHLAENFFDLYNYDAQHTESSQQRGVTHFVKNMKKEYIMVVDDWDFAGVESGTRKGFQIANLAVLKEWVMRTPNGELPNDHWHNGFAVFLLRK
jgi:hypothetical protein